MDSRQKSWIESNGPVSNSWISDPHCTNVWNQVISLKIQLGLQGLFLPHFNGVRTEQILLVFVTSLSYLLILKLFLLLSCVSFVQLFGVFTQKVQSNGHLEKELVKLKADLSVKSQELSVSKAEVAQKNEELTTVRSNLEITRDRIREKDAELAKATQDLNILR